MKPVIVGLDPGTTSAYAVLDFNGRLIYAGSKKNYSFDDLMRDATGFGKPVIAAGDKKETPGFIKEFSQKTGTVIYSPKYDTKKDEKKTIVRKYKYEDRVRNAHETDALASAIFAYEDVLETIKKLRRFLVENGKEQFEDEMIISIIEDRNINFKTLLERLEEKPKDEELKPKRRRQDGPASYPDRDLISYLEEENYNLQKQVDRLRSKVFDLKTQDIDIDAKTRKMLAIKEKRILFLEKRNRQTEKSLSKAGKRLSDLTRFVSGLGGSVLMKKLDNLGQAEYEAKKKQLEIKEGDILLVEDISVYSQAVVKDIEGKVKTIVCRGRSNRALEKDFIVIPASGLHLTETKSFASAPAEDYDRLVMEDAKKRIDDKSLRSIVDDYRTERINRISR